MKEVNSTFNKLKAFALAVLLSYSSMASANAFDYSYVGYKLSEQSIPTIPAKLKVACKQGDQAAEIQAAIDQVSAMKADKKTGFRGAVVLDEGTYTLSQPLYIRTSGVVLRGSGHKKTILQKTGFDRGAVIYIEGIDNRQEHELKSSAVPQEVLIRRTSTKEWINSLHCSNFGAGSKLGYWGWHPGEIDLEFTRTLKKDGSYNVPLPIAFDKDCKAYSYTWTGRIENSGVENLSLESMYNKEYPMDEDHAWNGVYIANAQNCWVRVIDFRHFAGSAVIIQRTGSQITVEDCRSFEPISELGGYRRRTFLTFGERCLFQRLYSEEGINDFSTGMMAVGPNVFSQCDAVDSKGFSGSTGSYASGILFDAVNIDGGDIKFCNLGLEKYGTGWNATNSTAYQCSAAAIYADSLPDGTNNYINGCWAQFNGTGNFENCNDHQDPWSLFNAQLSNRIGEKANEITRTYLRPTKEASSPTIEQAMQFAQEAYTPRVTMKEWADVDFKSNDGKAKYFAYSANKETKKIPSFEIKNGKLLIDDALAVGNRHDAPWWNGRVRYNKMQEGTEGLTRFVPGMEFQGATDRIDTVVAHFEKNHTLLLHQNYGLWYDRRRDDHERVRRTNGDVWGPFYEQASARSGQGKAWDGLSKYDLTRLNNYYFYRLNEFAKKGAEKGMLLYNDMYFQHNILEAGAHWVDCPWRSANNINNTGFPEPVPFASDKRIFMADYFYNENDPARRELHKQFIMKELDALSDNPNVIQSIGEEFTGPYHFVKFWLETVSEWEHSSNKKATIALAVNKDVQDSILKDPALNKVVDIIAIQQWWNHSKGVFAPQGGVNMAPRQYLRKIRVGKTEFNDVYLAVKEYRKKYPEKVVIYYAKSYPEFAWAALLAGGSCPAIPFVSKEFNKDVATMNPAGAMGGVYMMANKQNHALVYIDEANKSASLNLPDGSYLVRKVDEQSGKIIETSSINIGKTEFQLSGAGVFWVTPNNEKR